MKYNDSAFDLAVLMQDIVTFGAQPQNAAIMNRFYQLYWRLCRMRQSDTLCDMAHLKQFYDTVSCDLAIFDRVIVKVKDGLALAKLDKRNHDTDKEIEGLFSRLISLHVLFGRIDTKKLHVFSTWRFSVCVLIQHCILEFRLPHKEVVFNVLKYHTLLRNCGRADFLEETKIFFEITRCLRLDFSSRSTTLELFDLLERKIDVKQRNISRISELFESLERKLDLKEWELPKVFNVDADSKLHESAVSHQFGAIGEPIDKLRDNVQKSKDVAIVSEAPVSPTEKTTVAAETPIQQDTEIGEKEIVKIENDIAVEQKDEKEQTVPIVEQKKLPPNRNAKSPTNVVISTKAKSPEKSKNNKKTNKNYRYFPYKRVVEPRMLEQNWRRKSDDDDNDNQMPKAVTEAKKDVSGVVKRTESNNSPKKNRLPKNGDAQISSSNQSAKKTNGAAKYSQLWSK